MNRKTKALFFTVIAVGLMSASIAAAGTRLKPIATGSMSEGDAVIELAPRLKDDGTLVVRVTANTHSVDLSQYDLSKIVTLESNGKTIAPFQADRFRGHHANVKLKFKLDAGVKNFKIIITGIPGIQKRVYKWGS